MSNTITPTVFYRTLNLEGLEIFYREAGPGMEMQVRGGMLQRLGPGQVFYESPEDVHTVSRNTSKTKPAKFVVFFIKNEGAPILTPIH